jgi:glycerophosphoryl diester phosphodiesterase
VDRPSCRPPGPRPHRRLRLRLTAGSPGPRRPPQIIGHRGARGLFPENTIEGFLRTAALGVDAIELDVGLTADGVVVVHHDPRLNPALTRGPDGRYLRPPGPPLISLPAAAFSQYDVGRIDPASRLAAEHPAQRAIDGARIPTLAAVLAALPAMAFVIELKSAPNADPAGPPLWPDPIALAEATLLVCDSAPAPDRFVLQSFDSRPLCHLRDHRPDVPTAWLTLGARRGTARAVAAQGARRWSPGHAALTAATIRHAQALGLAVVPWTVNAPARMRRLIGHGVDGLITDRPDLARAVLPPPA